MNKLNALIQLSEKGNMDYSEEELLRLIEDAQVNNPDLVDFYKEQLERLQAAKPIPPFPEDTTGYDEDPDRHLKKAKLMVLGAYNNRVDEEEPALKLENLYIVSFTYILGGWKAMVSTNVPDDGLYFEVTHNASKEETYVDTYMKIANDKFSPEGE